MDYHDDGPLTLDATTACSMPLLFSDVSRYDITKLFKMFDECNRNLLIFCWINLEVPRLSNRTSLILALALLFVGDVLVKLAVMQPSTFAVHRHLGVGDVTDGSSTSLVNFRHMTLSWMSRIIRGS